MVTGDVPREVERDLARSTPLPGMTKDEHRRLLRDAWTGGLASGHIRLTGTSR